MASPEVRHPHVEAIKDKAKVLAEQMAERHNPDLVSQFVQFSLGVASMNRLFGVEVDLVQVMQSGAKLASHNLYPTDQEIMSVSLLSDEELCKQIVEANSEMIARGSRPATD